MNASTLKSLAGALLAAVVGVGVAWAGGRGGETVLGIPIFWIVVGGAYLVQWLAFIIAFIQKTEKFYDLTGSLTYITLTTLTVLLIPQIDHRAVLLLVLVVVWAARLGTFLFTRVLKAGKDDRFDEIKVDFGRFLLTWTLQGLWVTFTAAAAWGAITSSVRQPLDWFTVIGLIVWLVGFIFEVLADAQKSAFKAQPENEGQFIKNGLWAWSRHPNYFGEIVVWIGVALIALPVLRGWALLTLISPVWSVIQLTLISGVPMLEKKADQRWGDQADYQAYKQNTPVLFPWPPKKN
jgi:steroid 5-alpha reductase family enzyme